MRRLEKSRRNRRIISHNLHPARRVLEGSAFARMSGSWGGREHRAKRANIVVLGARGIPGGSHKYRVKRAEVSVWENRGFRERGSGNPSKRRRESGGGPPG